MLIKASTKHVIYLFIFLSLIFSIQFFFSGYLKDISIDLIKLLQKDEYIVTTMQTVNYLGSDQFRLLLMALVIAIGTRFQMILLFFIYSFSCLFVDFLKINIRDVRPFWYSNDIKGYDCSYDFGFPTDHIIITIPLTFYVFEVIYDMLNLNTLVNSKYFYLIGNGICALIGLSIGFSRFVLGLNYLDQYFLGILIGFLLWFFFNNFFDLGELKTMLEVKVVYNRKVKYSFILIYNLIYFIFLLNFLLVLKIENPELDDVSLIKNMEACKKDIYPLSPFFATLIDSTKYYCCFFLIICEMLQNNLNKLKKIRRAFHINEYNKVIFYDLCIKYYLSIKDKLDKKRVPYKSYHETDEDNQPSKAEYEFSKFLFIFVLFFIFVLIRLTFYWITVLIFNGNIIANYYVYELCTYSLIGFLSMKIHSKIDKYFKI